jgi:hypothetical protein
MRVGLGISCGQSMNGRGNLDLGSEIDIVEGEHTYFGEGNQLIILGGSERGRVGY